MPTDTSGHRGGEVQAVSRALTLLEAVGTAREIGVSELAREVDLAVSTVHSLVKTLAAHNYLIGDNGRYRLGPGVTVLTSQWEPVPSLIPVLRPVLAELNRTTKQAVTGRVLVGREAHTVGYFPGLGPITVSDAPAVVHDPLEIATGRILVAMGPEELWSEFIAAARERTKSITEKQWLTQLHRIRSTGLVISPPADARSQGALAVPVWGRNGSVLCSFGCSAPGFIIDELFNQAVVDAIWEAARELSERLGCASLPLPRPTIKPSRQPDRT